MLSTVNVSITFSKSFRLYKKIKRFSSNQIQNLTKIKTENLVRKMSAWQIHSYGKIDEVQFSNSVRIPMITSPYEVLVKVNAASINPIDLLMIGGYGSKLFNMMRCHEIEFPLTLGRDFTGTIALKGLNVPKNFNIDDKIWGVIQPHKQGCHSEYALVDSHCISHKPENISDNDAGSTLYAGLTAWSGIFVSGLLGGLQGAFTSFGGGKGKNVLVLGASGGVGNMAVQILRAENAKIIVSCSTDAMSLLSNLGADIIIDYNDPDAVADLVKNGPYDLILDCAGKGQNYASEIPWKYNNYVTFSSPLLRNIDSYGVGVGFAHNLCNLLDSNIKSLSGQKGIVKWGYFLPAPHGIEYLTKLVENNKLLPIIQEVFPFEKLIEAYKRVAKGHLRGKIIIDLKQ